jgi:hypothetical protein
VRSSACCASGGSEEVLSPADDRCSDHTSSRRRGGGSRPSAVARRSGPLRDVPTPGDADVFKRADPLSENGARKLFTELPRQTLRHPARDRVLAHGSRKSHIRSAMTRTHSTKLPIAPRRSMVRHMRGALATSAPGSTIRSANRSRPSRCVERWENEGGRWLNHEPEAAHSL